MTLRAMTVATTAIRYDGVSTLLILAARDIAAQACGAAGQDRAHHLQLRMAHMAAVSVKPSGAKVAEDIGDFQSGALHERARLLRWVLLRP